MVVMGLGGTAFISLIDASSSVMSQRWCAASTALSVKPLIRCVNSVSRRCRRCPCDRVGTGVHGLNRA
jgi:hypothetical protein